MMRSWLIVPLFVALSFNSALAQGEREDVQLRNRCRQYAHWLEMGPKQPHYEEALSGIDDCDESGGAVLADLWSKITAADSGAVGELSYRSARFRDRTLLDGLLTQFADASRARLVRMAILDVLVSFYDAGKAPPFGVRQEGINPEYCTLTSEMHFDATDGVTPVTPADRPRILDALNAIASGDPDSFVRSAAACTAAALALMPG